MQQQQNSTQLTKLQRIAQQLEQNKQLKVINLDVEKGSFSQVVIAEHLQYKSLHAVKIISIFDGVDQASEQKLQDAKEEAVFLQNINHLNIVKYQDEFQIGFNYFIVMEKCEKNLQQYIEDYKNQATEIPKQIIISFACQILSAINYLHNQKQMLRDLSLRNILIDSDNQIKLCDFGQAKQVQEELTSSSLMLKQFPNQALYYYPPDLFEQLLINTEQSQKGYIQNLNGDIWAFGICLYALAGASLIQCSSVKSKGYQKIPYLGESLNQILSQVLSLDPSKRPNILKLIDIFQDIQKKIWTQDDALNLYNQYLVKKNANQWYLAYQFISICCQIQQKNEDYWFELGNTQVELGFSSEAIKSYQKCLEINHKHDSCFKKLRITYRDQEMQSQPIKSYEKLQKNDQAVNSDDKKNFDEAIRQYYRCLQINPNDDSCYYNLGVAYMAKGILDEAIKSFQKCLEINLNNDIYYYNLGVAQEDSYMLDEAIISYQKCLEINPKNYCCHFNLGTAYYLKGTLDEDIKLFYKCLSANPKNDSYYYTIQGIEIS
ncbi:hypothetical protein ABPG74_019071 [Tetrahymena malaccensis]